MFRRHMHIATIDLSTENDTSRVGQALAAVLRPTDVVCLSGPLGAGKTTFARAVIEATTGATDAPSPTFTLVEVYESDAFDLWHFDLYRLEKPGDIWELGFEDCLDAGIALIEWPERAEGLLPENALNLSINFENGSRKLTISGDKDWDGRLAKAGIA